MAANKVRSRNRAHVWKDEVVAIIEIVEVLTWLTNEVVAIIEIVEVLTWLTDEIIAIIEIVDIGREAVGVGVAAGLLAIIKMIDLDAILDGAAAVIDHQNVPATTGCIWVRQPKSDAILT